MTSAEPARPAVSRGGDVQASVLAALQLVEDAHQFGSDRHSHRARARMMAERTVAHRRASRGRAAGWSGDMAG